MVYTGDMSNQLVAVPDCEFLMSERIPLTFLQPYQNQGYRLFVDNFYTSTRLAEFMSENGTTLVGTVRPNRRDFPTALADVAIEKGEAKFAMSDNGVLAVKFRSHKDKSGKKTKIVYMLTTCHPNALTQRRHLHVNVHAAPKSSNLKLRDMSLSPAPSFN